MWATFENGQRTTFPQLAFCTLNIAVPQTRNYVPGGSWSRGLIFTRDWTVKCIWNKHVLYLAPDGVSENPSRPAYIPVIIEHRVGAQTLITWYALFCYCEIKRWRCIQKFLTSRYSDGSAQCHLCSTLQCLALIPSTSKDYLLCWNHYNPNHRYN